MWLQNRARCVERDDGTIARRDRSAGVADWDVDER